MKILITGGAGFIGSFLVDELVRQGHQVRIFDNLEPQVHPGGEAPDYLNPRAEFIRADLRNREALSRAVKGMEIIFHQAAMVGVGQSMYQVSRYVEANSLGTANLLDILVNDKHHVRKLLIPSSMSTYGEGSYDCPDCGPVSPPLRPEEQMERGDWEVYCPVCGKICSPASTPESKLQEINSIYALSKKDQEEMSILIGKSYRLPVVALRYFNVYGPRQSLSNPYTGVAAIFLSRLKNRRRPLVFEDGLQSRDFISVHDIVRANLMAMDDPRADGTIYNVGSGRQLTVLDIAETLARLLDVDIEPEILGKFRKGDVRHCFADITKIKTELGFKPAVPLEKGMEELIEWSRTAAAEDKVEQATRELVEKGLVGD